MNTATFSLAQLKEMAKEHFDNLGTETLFATSDGQFFLLENRANLHANGDKRNRKNVYKLENENPPAEPQEKTEKPMGVKELAAKVLEITDLDELRNMLTVEVAGPNRATAVKAIEDRLVKLTTDERA